LEKTAYVIYLVCLVLGPLFFGLTDVWAYTIVFLGVLAASLLVLRTDVARKNGEWVFRAPKTDLDPLIWLFAVFLLFQMTPLPETVLMWISPESAAVGGNSLSASQAASPAAAKPWFAVAPYVHPVKLSLIRWVVYGLFFLGLLQTLKTRDRVETLVMVLLVSGCFQALYGIAETFSGHHQALWLPHVRPGRDVQGSYLNRNHFAGFMEMGIALAVGYAGAFTAGRRTNSRRSYGRERLKDRVLRIFSGRRLQRFLILFSGVVMGVGLILSASRGGVISAAFALLVMGLLFYARKDQRPKGRIVLALFALTLVYALIAGIDYTVSRFQAIDIGHEARLRYLENTMQLFDDYFAAGVGVGNFQHAFLKFHERGFEGLIIDYAHNDWAQLLVETGIAGMTILIACLLWFLCRAGKVWVRRRNSFSVCMGVAMFGAVAALAVHSFFDFNLHRPANALLLAAVLAIGIASLRLDGGHKTAEADQEVRILPLRGAGAIAAGAALLAVLWAGAATIKHFIAESYCHTQVRRTLNLPANPPPEYIEAAISWDCGNAAYSFRLAQALATRRNVARQETQDREAWQRSHGPIIEALERAVRLNPLNAEYHVMLGWEYTYLWHERGYMTRWMKAADTAMERGAFFGGTWGIQPRLHVDMGHYWAMRSKNLGPARMESAAAWSRACWHYNMARQLLGARKGLQEEIRNYLKSFYTDEEHIRQALGEEPA